MSIYGNGWDAGSFSNPGGFERMGSERRYGVELEYFDVDNFRDLRGHTVFGAKDDGSVDGEFYSPILSGDNGLAECEKFCDLARRAGFRADNGAGFHAHFDLSRENPTHLKSIVLAYHATYPFWKLTVPQHRASSHWAEEHDYDVAEIKRISGKQRMKDFAERGRYQWVNFAAYNKFGTVELRSHEATHNGADVVNWVKAHARFIDAVATLDIDRVEKIFAGKSVRDIVREMRVILRAPDVMAHLGNRMNRFNPGCRSRRRERTT